MQVEAKTTISRPRSEVFGYLAHAEHLPEYVGDFESVSQASDGEPAEGTEYRYKMKRGGTEGTFQWTEFEPDSRLAWHGPPVKSGPGSMEPAGWWELTDEGSATRVKLVMAPSPGGLFKVIAPLMSFGMRRGNARAMQKLKDRLEGTGRPAGRAAD
jgi:uncharacterized protein YndB with AHSA1/START domain